MKSKVAAILRSVPRPAHAAERVPRARPDVLLGDVAHVHRAHLHAVRAQEHRRRGGASHRLPAALGRVHRREQAPTSSCSPTRCVAAVGADGRGATGLGRVAAVQHHDVVRIDDSIASRWGPRIVLFVSARRERTSERWKRAPHDRDPRAWRAGGWAAVLVVLVGSLVLGLGIGPVSIGVWPIVVLGALARAASCACTRALTSTDCDSLAAACAARRARGARRRDARRSPARRTRACSATRSPTRTCSAWPPAPASARRSRSRIGARRSACELAAGRGVRRCERRGGRRLRRSGGRPAPAQHGRRSSSPASPSPPSSRRCRRSSSSSTPTRCRRSTR